MNKTLLTYGTGYFENNVNVQMEWNDNIIVLTDLYSNGGHDSSSKVTNSMEQCLSCVIEELAKRSELLKDKQIYQWCPGEGLFKVSFRITAKVTRDWPPAKIDNVQWEYVSKDMSALRILYDK